MVNRLRENDQVISILMGELSSGESRLQKIPLLLKRVIREDMWREREMQANGRVAIFNRFIEFVTAPPREGLGTDLDTLKRLCRDDPEALDLIDQVEQRPHGGRHESKLDNVQVAPTGNSRQRSLRRLREARPDLHGRVLRREMTAHAAMVEAGFRRRTITVPTEPELAARALVRHFNRSEMARLIEFISQIEEADVM